MLTCPPHCSPPPNRPEQLLQTQWSPPRCHVFTQQHPHHLRAEPGGGARGGLPARGSRSATSTHSRADAPRTFEPKGTRQQEALPTGGTGTPEVPRGGGWRQNRGATRSPRGARATNSRVPGAGPGRWRLRGVRGALARRPLQLSTGPARGLPLGTRGRG